MGTCSERIGRKYGRVDSKRELSMFCAWREKHSTFACDKLEVADFLNEVTEKANHFKVW